MKNNQSKGIFAENVASLYLQSKNFQIVARRFYTKYGEIDIIATLDSMLVFVEVKNRFRIENFLDSISQKKLQSLKHASEVFLQQNHSYMDKGFRYDVIFLSENSKIIHLKNIEVPDNDAF